MTEDPIAARLQALEQEVADLRNLIAGVAAALVASLDDREPT